MSDPKLEGPRAPAEWQQPESAEVNSADRSFNDDVVAARIKMQEAALARLAHERLHHELPRDVLAANKKVEKPGAYTPAGSRRDEGRLRPQQRQAADAARGRRRAGGHTSSDPLDFLQGRIGVLMDELGELEEAPSRPPGQQHEGPGGAAAARAARMARADHTLRMHLQLLLSGALGFRLLHDPRLALARLLARLRRWPARVRPGHPPSSDEDFDAFFAWVFAPPPRPATIDEPFATTGA